MPVFAAFVWLDSPEKAFLTPLYVVAADFFIRQIAGRIRRPNISGYGFGPNPEVAAADIQPPAVGAPAGNIGFFVLELFHQRVRQVGPDLGERPCAHIAETPVPPELVRIYLAVPADTADAPSGIVAFVHAEQLKDLLCPLTVLF